MERTLINCLLQNTLTTRADLFGENCAFVSFEEEGSENSKWAQVGFHSSVRFGRIVYCRDNKVEHSPRLLLKESSSTMACMEEFSFSRFFNEVCFYTKIIPFFRAINPSGGDLFPEYYNSLLQYNVNAPDDGVILFENLQAAGYSLARRQMSFLDYDHLSLVVRKLGQFHAYSYRAREAFPDRFHAFTHCCLETSVFALKQLPTSLFVRCAMGGLQPLSVDPRYSSKSETLREIIADCDRVFRDTLRRHEDNRTHVLCHGDFWRNNFLFRYDDDDDDSDGTGKPTDMKLVDLATWRFASPAIDVASVLYLNADQKMRDENWDKLVDEYYAALSGTFPSTEAPSKESILREFNANNVMFTYFVAGVLLPFLVSDADAPELRVTDLLQGEHKDSLFSELPHELVMESCSKMVGGSSIAAALTDILKDIIDRGFV